MYCLPHFQLSWALKKWSSFIILWCTMGCLLTLQWWWMGKTWANTERWANQQAPNGKEEEQENKPASPAARRPFPMQVHQCTTSTYSAKVPLLLNQLWNLDVFSNLDCPLSVHHCLFNNWKSYLSPFGRTVAGKSEDEEGWVPEWPNEWEAPGFDWVW